MTVSSRYFVSLPTSASLQVWAKQLLAHTSSVGGVLDTDEQADFMLDSIRAEHGESTHSLTCAFLVRMHNAIRRDAADLFQAEDLAAELRGIAEANWQGYAAWAASETGILHGDRVRQIGVLADQYGSLEGMQEVAVAALVNHPDRDLAIAAMSEITTVWAGVGSWQA